MIPDNMTQTMAEALAASLVTGQSVIRTQQVSYDTLMSRPVQAPISRTALDNLVRAQTATVPLETLRESLAAQQREAHNEAIDKRKAKKREFKKIAKDAGISTATLRRMLGRK